MFENTQELFEVLERNQAFTIFYFIVLLFAVCATCFSFSARYDPLYVVYPSGCDAGMYNTNTTFRLADWYLSTRKGACEIGYDDDNW